MTSQQSREIHLHIRLSGRAALDLEALTDCGSFPSPSAAAEHIVNCFVSPVYIGWQRAQPSWRVLPRAQESELRPKQTMALELLARGQTDTEVARAVGVGRETVNRWRRHNPNFQACLKKRLDLVGEIAQQSYPDDIQQQITLVLQKYLPKKQFQFVAQGLEQLAHRSDG